ncbi:MAG: VWA domain-containing protein [Pirellulaceae bacterium]
MRVPLSSDYNATQGQMNQLSSVPINGFTNIDEGIRKGIETLTDPTRIRPLAEKTMVLLSDGLANRGRNPKFAADEAKAANIVIHTISFGDDADKSKMQEVADITGGNSYHAPDAASLEAIFREIALTLPVLMTE